jgi:DNA helicase-2/ATP-dependent DNA helicase PcrA
VVGDADQSIYAFRGATIRNIEDFPDATTILLEQNYRSTQTILSAANSVIAQRGPPGEAAVDRRRRRELIVGYVADNEHDEARFVAGEIDALAAGDGEFTYNDVAVFYRTNNSSARSKRCSSAPGSRTRSSAGSGSTSAGRSATSSPTCGAGQPGDAVSMRRILNTPRRGIGDRAEACGGVRREHRRRLQRRPAGRRGAGADAEFALRRRRSRRSSSCSTSCAASSARSSAIWSRRCSNAPATVAS